MRKGRFGIVLCFYPIVAFAAVILQSFGLAALALAVAVFLERDEWTGRQTLQAVLLAAIVWCFRSVSRQLGSMPYVPIFSDIIRTAGTVVFVFVYLAAIVLSILAIVRVMKEQEANLPLLSDLAHRVYGKRPAKPVNFPQPYGQPSVPPLSQPAQPNPNPVQQPAPQEVKPEPQPQEKKEEQTSQD